MRILRTTLLSLTGLGATLALSVSVVAGGRQAGPTKAPAMQHDMPMPAAGAKTSPMTKAQKITNAMAAAPQAVSAKATILDWPAKEGDQPPVLRAGTNGWTCFPDSPDTPGNDPMCLDAAWMKWIEAYLAHKPVAATNVGIGYMIAPGGGMMSNTDPYAMKMTPDNHWGYHPPHLMIAVPDLKALDGLPTDPDNGGPYVMWKGTPYAHIMAPVAVK
jgi:hypothetical protein